MIAWFIRNSVAANLLMITILLAGTFSALKLIPLEVFPNLETDDVIITMEFNAATPEDVEKGITIRIEEAIADLEGIEEISSVSSEGSATVTVETDSSYDPRELLADIKSRVDAINTFPSEAEKPVIELKIRKRDVIVLTLASNYGEIETREYSEELKNKLLKVQGITQVELSGVRDFEIAIEVSQDKLLQYNLTISDVSNAIKNSSLDLSGGNLKTLGGDVLVRVKDQAYNKKDFSSIIIKKNSDGAYVRLGDIASVKDGFEETAIRSKFNGKNAVFLDVYRVGNQSAIEVADKVKNFIKEQEKILPQGYEINYWDDDSKIVKSRLNTLASSAIQGSILIIILLTLFLRPAIAFWVFLGIPISFAGALFMMSIFDVTLNLLSLFGFILVLGIVVDDAIVTGENIYTHLKKSSSGEAAAINGTKEIAKPVTFGILTTVAAFIPLAFIEGDRSALFSQLPFVMVPVLIFSLIESKFILPAHLKHIKVRGEKNKIGKLEKLQHKFADGFESTILKYYQPLLKLALENKFTTLSLFISTLAIIIALIVGGWTKFIFFPKIPSERIQVTLTMPTGTPFELTNKHVIDITNKAKILQEKYRNEDTNKSVIINIMTITGGRGGTSNIGEVAFEITPEATRKVDISAKELADEWRKLVGDIPGAESTAYKAELGRVSAPIDIQLTGSSLEILKENANQIKEYLRTYQTIFDITDTLSNGKDELKIELTKEGEFLGITKLEISNQVREAIYGSQAQRIQRGRDDVKVMVRLPKEQRQSISNLEKLLITTSNGERIPLGNVAKLIPAKGPSSITRIDRFRTVNVTADVEKENINMVVFQEDLKVYLDELISKHPSISYTLEGEAREQNETFTSIAYSLIFVFFAMYALLAIPFKSYIQPIIVMSVIPFGIIGAVMGHWILQMDLTILSFMGMLALIGVMVNDSLVLVDYINTQYRKSNKLLNSVLTAGAARFRPVILTSLTTFIGLLPLMFEKSIQAQFLIPMAASLAFGILFATFTTLILIPINYVLVETFVQKVKKFYK